MQVIMWIVIVSLLLGFIMATFGFITIRRRYRIRKFYSSKSRKEILEAKVFAKKMMILSFCIAFLGPLPFVFIILIISFFTKGIQLIIGIVILMILLISSSIVNAFYWWTVEGVTRSILKELSFELKDSSYNDKEKST
ncbi:MAG: hypothetical protein KAT05_11445 [Spirochaetes bacterium]|nr:hypothetical protein [Spirochaetota bacterium]